MLNILIDLCSAFGAISIMVGSCFILVFKLLENKYNKFSEKQKSKLTTVVVVGDHSGPTDGPVSMLLNNVDNGEKLSKSEKIDRISNKKKSFRMFILKFIFLKY